MSQPKISQPKTSQPRPLRELLQEQTNAPIASPPRPVQSAQATQENEEPEWLTPEIPTEDVAPPEPVDEAACAEAIIRSEAIESGIQLLMAAKDASARIGASAPEALSGRRRNRPLGRAASSLSASDFPADTAASMPAAQTELETQPASQSQRIWLYQAETQDKRMSMADLEPSQRITYGDAGMQDRKEKIIKKLGGRIDETTIKRHAFASIGVVRDELEDASVASRVRRRK